MSSYPDESNEAPDLEANLAKPKDATVEIMFDLLKTVPERQTTLSAQLDTKMIQLFQAGSVVIGLAGFASGVLTGAATVVGILLMASLGFYVLTAALVFGHMFPRRFRTLNVADLWTRGWKLAPTQVQQTVIAEITEAFVENRSVLKWKAWYLIGAIVTITCEVVLVGLALILSRLVAA